MTFGPDMSVGSPVVTTSVRYVPTGKGGGSEGRQSGIVCLEMETPGGVQPAYDVETVTG
jgi:hypothetical protein